MDKQVYILVIPGIGTQTDKFSEPLEKDLKRFTSKEVRSNLKIYECRPFFLTGVDDNQDRLYKRLKAKNKLGGILSLRRMVLSAFGDAVTFERASDKPNSIYRQIHKIIKKEVEEISKLMNEGDVFITVASSMGVQVLSTYIWDADNGIGIFKDEPATNANNLKNLHHLASVGCNIPLFLSGFNESDIICFEKRNDVFTWDNYYDQDDVLGWPLKQLSPSYDQMVNDHEINTGLYVGSHMRYWDDNDFTKPLSAKIDSLYGAG